MATEPHGRTGSTGRKAGPSETGTADKAAETGRAAETEFARMANEFGRMLSKMQLPAMPDMDTMMAAHRRNMETLSAANRVALEGAQTVARRHMEMLQQTMTEMSETLRSLATAGAPRDKAKQQAEMLRTAYEHAVANMRELSELIQKSNTEALGLLNKRFAEAMEEVQALIAKSGTKAKG